MKLEEIQNLWSVDVQIDRSELGSMSLNIPFLHNKYFKIFSTERLILKKMQEDLKVLKNDKYDFYQDGPTEEQMKMGWKLPPKGRILKSDVPRYVETDSDIIKENLKIAYQQEKIEFLESILKTIGNMGYHIATAVRWEQFKNGM